MKKYFVVAGLSLRNLIRLRQIAATVLIFVSISSAHTFRGVSMAPNTLKGWVVTSDTGFVYYTLDCGLTWINQSFPTSRFFYDVFFLNEQKGWLGANRYGYIYHTENGGVTWSIQAMGLAHFVNRIFLIDDSCGWAPCSGAIVGRTTNGGNYWEQIFLPWPPFQYDTVDVKGISFVDSLRGWFCAGRFAFSDPWPWDTMPGGQGYIAKSIDGGFNWQLLLKDTINDFFDIKFLDTLNGFVIGGNDRTMSATIMKTQNGGITWQPLSIPSQSKYLRSLKIIGNKIWAVGHQGTILHSDNGGNNWTMQTSPIDTTLYDIDFSDSIHGLIAGDGCVLYTYNGGNTWNVSNIGMEEEIASLPLAMTADVRVYPNPAKTYISIRIPEMLNQACPGDKARVQYDRMVIKIYDVKGMLIKEIATSASQTRNDKLVRISLDGIKNGIYFVKVTTTLSLRVTEGNPAISQTKIEKIVIIK